MAKFLSNAAEAARLGRGKSAVIAFESSGILARFTKKGTARARDEVDFERQMTSILRLGTVVAARIRDRVAKEGKIASSGKSYSPRPPTVDGKPHRYAVAEPYAALVSGDGSPAATSSAWHQQAGVKRNTFDVTGGMWKGLQVRQRSHDAVAIDFRGTSVGGTGKPSRETKKVKDKKTGLVTTKEVKRSEKTRLNVANKKKAGRIFSLMRVNVVQPSESENIAMAAAVAAQAHLILQDSLGEKPPGSRVAAGDPRLFDLLMRRWVKR